MELGLAVALVLEELDELGRGVALVPEDEFDELDPEEDDEEEDDVEFDCVFDPFGLIVIASPLSKSKYSALLCICRVFDTSALRANAVAVSSVPL